MARMTGGEAIVAALVRHGVDTVFGLPGAQVYALFDAIAREPKLRLVGARHEQACGYMAFGYARAGGRPGVYAVVPGPGVLNTGAALVTALGCNEPVLCLTGQVPSAFLGRGRGHLHELPDQLATLRGLTKWTDRIEAPAAAPLAVAEAFRAMQSGRKGPAALEMPWDRLAETGEVADIDPLAPAPPPEPDGEAIERAAALVREARAPMIFVGSGAIGAAGEVLRLAERLRAPVVAFRSGRGIVGDDHPLGLTIASAHRLWPETDCAIAIGTRFELPEWRWSWRPPGLKTVRIDIDPAEQRRLATDVFVLADAITGTKALTTALGRKARGGGRGEAIAEAKRAAAKEIAGIKPHAAFLAAIRDVLPPDGIFVDEMCQAGFASWFAFPVTKPRTFVSSGYQGTLGAGFPTALGAKIARPDVPVVSVTGDGGFLFAVGELATAVQHGIGVTIVVFNNNSYGNVRRDQQTRFEGRIAGADLVNPDFLRLARAFGVEAERARTPTQLRRALVTAFADGGPRLIEVPVDPDSEVSPWRFIHPAPPHGSQDRAPR